MGTQLTLPKGAHTLSFLAQICCGQTAGWIKMPHGTEVGLGPHDIVLCGDPAPPYKGHSYPLHTHFMAHVYCGQMAGWIKMPLVTKVGLRTGHIVLHGDTASPIRGTAPQFSAHVYCGQRIAHLSYC